MIRQPYLQLLTKRKKKREMAKPVKIEDNASKANRHRECMYLLLATLCGEKK